MMLVWLIVIPLIAGVLAWLAARWSTEAPRWISLAAAALGFLLSLAVWIGGENTVGSGATTVWLAEFDSIWMPRFGIHFHLAVDGLSLLMLVLTFFLGIMSVLCSWTVIRERIGFFHFNLLWMLAGIAGVFVALDLVLFYFALELMLIPMYFLIVTSSHEYRIPGAIKSMLFTQLS